MPDYSMKFDLDAEERTVTAYLRERGEDGEWEVVDTASFSLDGVHESLTDMVALYGLSKKLQDGASSTPVGPDKLVEMNAIFAALAEGKWERERTRGPQAVSAEVEALAAIYQTSVGAVQKKLRSLSKEQREKILSHPKVKEKADAIRAAREAAEGELDFADLA